MSKEVRYLGVKFLKDAQPMTAAEYNEKYDRNIPEEKGDGYTVVYEGKDEYRSWSPKKEFENAYRPCDNLTWGLAKEAIDKGLMVSREGWWADKRYCVYRQVNSTIPIDIVPKMQSLPQSVKDMITDRTMKSISYENQIAMIDEVNVIRAFTPTTEDLDAEDWYIVS